MRSGLMGCLLAATAFTFPLAAQRALAQGTSASEETGLEEVVVTARRRGEDIQDVPVAVTAVTGEMLREQTVVRFEDLARLAPGFAASQSVRGGASPSYSIRGQRGPTTQTLLLDPAVGVYFAELNLSRGTGTNQTLYDLQSVQVLKGPQGTLFGRNSTGGAVLIEPNRPTGEFEGYAQLSLGSYDYRDFEAALNIPLGETASLRLAGKSSRRDGYLKSVLTGQKANDLDADSVRLTVQFRPSDNFESAFIGSYFKGGGVGGDVKLFFVEPQGVPAAFGVGRPFVISGLQNELAATQALGEYENRNPFIQASKDKAWSVQNNTTLKLGELSGLGDVTLKNVIGYRRIKNAYGQNFTGGNIDLFHYENAALTSESFSEEFQVQGDRGRLKYIAGVYYFREEGTDAFTSVQGSYLVSPAVIAAGGPALAAFVAPRFPSRNRTDVDAKNISYAVFLHADYDLSGLLDGLSLAGGARLTKDKRHVVWHGQNAAGLTPAAFTCAANGVLLPAVNRDACGVSAKLSTSELTYNVSLNYKPTPDLLLYLAHRRGYRTGGFNAVPPVAPITEGRSFEPEYVRDAELGVKLDFRVGEMVGRVNAAAFYQWYTDIQRTSGTLDAAGRFTSRVVNRAKAHMPGGEIEFTLRPIPSLQLSANYAIVEPKYDVFNDLRIVNGQPVVIDVSDSRFAFVPYRQYSVSARYTFPTPEELGEVSFAATLAGQGGMATSEPETANCGPGGIYLNCLTVQGAIPGYRTLNLRLDWRNVADRGVDVAVFGNNVTDRFYRTWAVNVLSSLGFASASIGAPSMWGVEVRVPFGAAR